MGKNWVNIGANIGWVKIRLVLRLLLVAYGALALYGWLLSDRQIFVPPAPTYPDTPDLLKLETEDGTKIAVLHLTHPTATHTILYSHGNGEDLGQNRPFMVQLQSWGLSVLAYDYPGYGHSEGKPTEAGAYQAIDAAYQYLIIDQQLDPKTIILHGRSVGGGPAVDLAIRRPVGGLILESTFVSTFRVVTRIRLLPFDKFANLAKIPQLQVPVLVIHGTADATVPFWHGEALFAAIPTPKRSFWVAGAGHNDLIWVAGDAYFETIQDFIASPKETES
jgi:fermentation-respiration switch protein FrsA (DUF1100 family)